jgi:pyridoxal phosphate-dependent aminotransferase EpsN
MTQAFEQLELEFGQVIGNPNTVAVSSGTAALHIACEVARTKITDDVTGEVKPSIAIPEYTMVACARAAAMADLDIHFVDCNDDLQMNMDLVPDQMHIVMAVHIYGNLCDVDALHSKPYKPLVIEDMAEVHGAKPHPDSFAACWSFYKNKTIHGEEGGMIAFKNPQNVRLAKQLRTLGFDDNHDYFHVPRGVNARMSNTHAELILPSLRRYKDNCIKRLILSGEYITLVPYRWQMPLCYYPWIFPIHIKGMNRFQQRELVLRLNEKGIAARQGFKSMKLQAEFKHLRGNPFLQTNAMLFQHEIIYLPLSETMSRDNVARICDELMNVAKIVIPLLTPAV